MQRSMKYILGTFRLEKKNLKLHRYALQIERIFTVNENTESFKHIAKETLTSDQNFALCMFVSPQNLNVTSYRKGTP